MKSVRVAVFVRIAAILLLPGMLSLSGEAQGDGYTTNSNARGLIPFGSYQVGGIDNENLATGTVNLRIPLTERKGRGSDTNLTYVYSSKIWVVAPLGDPTSPDWVPATLWQPTSELLQGQIVTLGWGSLTWTSQTYTCTMANQNQYWVVVDSNFVYIEADGAHIQFPNRRITAQPGYVSPAGCVIPTDPCKFCVPPGGPQVPTGHSDTGTMELDTSGDPFVIRFKDGRQAFWPANSIDATRTYKDRNGNLVDPNGDTLKRMVFADSSGNPLGYSTATSFITVNTQFPTTGSASYPNCMHQYGSNQFQVTTSLSLPNGRSYTFEYDPNFGELTRVNLPTGGYIKFVYQTFPQIDSGLPVGVCTGLPLDSRRVVERRVSEDGVNEQVWHYNYVVDLTGKQPTYTDVTDPLGNVTRHIFANQGGGVSEVQTETRDAAGNLLRKVVNDWAWDRLSGPTQMDQDGTPSGGGAKNLRIVGTTTTLVDSNQVSRTETDYETFSYPDASNLNHPATESTMNVTETREFDYGVGVPGAQLRRTDYAYLHDADTNYQSRHIWDRVTSRIVYDGQGNVAAKTQYGYDGTTITATSNVVQHDYVNYGSTMPYRGNVTTTKVWRNTDDSWLTTTNWYDDLGNVVKTQDPGGHNTWFYYDDSWSGTACLPPGPTRAFVTQVKNHLGQTVSHSYYPCSSLAASVTDQNSQTTTFTYDFFDRPLVETRPPGGGSTTFTYDDVKRQVTHSVEIGNGVGPMVGILSYDGLGRHNQTQQKDPEGDDFTETTYDALGQVATVSNPHRATASTTDGITTSQYDALGRVTKVTKQDGSFSTVAYKGNCTTATDEAGKQRRSCSDALGQLIEVDEPGDPYPGAASSGALSISGTLQSFTSGGHGATTASGSVSIDGLEGSVTNWSDPSCYFQPDGLWVCPPIYDFGYVWITINGFTASVTYDQYATDTGIAASLANALNVSSSPVHASASGTTVAFTTWAAGASANYSLSADSATYDPGDFGGASFTASASGSQLTGGTDAFGGNVTYDYGTVTFAIGGNSATANYGASAGQDSTAAQVASDLASKLTAQNPPFTINASGANLIIGWKTVGTAGNVSATCTSATQSGSFSAASFTCPGSTALAGGADPEGISLDHNYFVTLYSYDTLGNLLSVTQKGDPAVTTSSQWRVRTFAYNSLSQLLTAANPESGTLSYSYDADGNLLQKTSPAPNAQPGSTATQTISYCYDVLHRVTGKAYSAQTCTNGLLPAGTAAVSYAYDSGTNGIGHMTSLADQAGSGTYSYDVMGRIAGETRVIAGVSKSMSYEYNLDGSLKILHYPSGAAVTYTPDAAGRMLSAVDVDNNIKYATSATYGPDGTLTGFVSGNSSSFAGITNSFSFNKRLQPVFMSASAPSQTVFSLGYDFHLGNGDNGNVFGITNNKDSTRNQTFTYDALNRLASAQNAGTDCSQTVLGGRTKFWGNNYGYDAWGNLLSKAVTKCSAESLSVTALANNQLTGYTYDAAGNMVHDSTSGLNYSYDQENRITGANGYTYTYDDDGNRVEKSNGSTGTLYWYMAPGIVAESDLTGALKSEYVFFDGERVARRDGVNGSGGVFYYFSDHLKTTDIVTDAQGNILNESDFYPWGGELQFLANDSNHYKFTGKERDAETGLDYFGARYYANALGRFITPDWSTTPVPVPYADLTDPQSLNQYSYVRNIPTVKIDADGHCFWDVCVGEAVVVVAAIAITAAVLSTPAGQQALKSAGQLLQKATDKATDAVQALGEGCAGAGNCMTGITPPGGPNYGSSKGPEKDDNNSKSENSENSGSTQSSGSTQNGSGTGSGSGTQSQTGSYTNTHESGKTYSGKGSRARSQTSGKRIEQQTGDKHTATDWTPSANGREAFKDESRRIDANGGAKSSSNHNQRESPGKKYRKQDASK